MSLSLFPLHIHTCHRFHTHTHSHTQQGMVFILYDSTEAAARALKIFNGRLFSGHIIAAEYYPLEMYLQKHPEAQQQQQQQQQH